MRIHSRIHQLSWPRTSYSTSAKMLISAIKTIAILACIFVTISVIFFNLLNWSNHKNPHRRANKIDFAWEDRQHWLEELHGLYVHVLRTGELGAPKLIDNRNSQLAYNLSSGIDEDVSEHGQSKKIAEIFNFKTNGTFFEAGAFNGEFFSNSLYLERKYGWTGILVEPVKEFYHQSKTKNRKAILLNACISPHPWFQYRNLTVLKHDSKRAQSMSFVKGFFPTGSVTNNSRMYQDQVVSCYPLGDMLAAANMTSLDVLMLDVQGPEIEILKTVPWRLINIKVIQIEISVLGKSPEALADQERKVTNYMEGIGYQLIAQISRDFIFRIFEDKSEEVT